MAIYLGIGAAYFTYTMLKLVIDVMFKDGGLFEQYVEIFDDESMNQKQNITLLIKSMVDLIIAWPTHIISKILLNLFED